MIWYWLYRFCQRHREWLEWHEMNTDDEHLLDAMDRFWWRMPPKYRERLERAAERDGT